LLPSTIEVVIFALEGDKATLSYAGQNFEKIVKTKNREHFCGSPEKIC